MKKLSVLHILNVLVMAAVLFVLAGAAQAQAPVNIV